MMTHQLVNTTFLSSDICFYYEASSTHRNLIVGTRMDGLGARSIMPLVSSGLKEAGSLSERREIEKGGGGGGGLLLNLEF